MSYSMPAYAATSLKACAQHITAKSKAVGEFMYGNTNRTQRSLCFAYGCITLYLVAVVNAPLFAACAR